MPVPFALGFQIYPWVERLLRVRGHPLAAYGFALVIVAVAVLARWSIGEDVGGRIPFSIFYPAIILATVIGGLWPGILAAVLSFIAAWYFLSPPYFGFTPISEREVTQLLLFAVLAGVTVAVVGLLDRLVERLIIQQRNIRVLLDSAPNGFVLVDENGTIKLVNASAETLFGYRREELLGKDIETLVPEQHVSEHRKLRAAYQQKPEVRLMGAGRDLSGRRKDGSEFPVEIGLNPTGRDGQPAILATVMDISARKQAEESQRLVIAELKHRTRNLLTVVQAIINNSLKDTKTVAEASYVLNGRVKALSQAYSLLADAAWEGTSLAKILSAQSILDAKRVTVDGCEVNVTARVAQQFAMIIHELSTNALKYGALSVPDGRIAILGKLDRQNGNGSFVFSWKESGGPRVSPPTRKGFGSAILLDAAQQFGEVSVEYLPEGLSYQLRLDLKEVESATVLTFPTTPTLRSSA